ncbi:NifU family protein [Natronomonas gomsonensis]|jgi:Fe/S biogenesis protein NfuA|uniref:NifU family protein n=1 Tax=Natronomonas gomsonensis TaxID=1046043 RepID=UPI0020CA81CA|nr:NifU family protein [Natronomonas gomsonensis]MCY4730423.1 NifU family protein [Natronomonas gomsonensis]
MTTVTADENDLRERIMAFLRKNFPQIEMHGGSAAIQQLDMEAGSVTIRLGGACSGCGVSPMTTQALKTRLVQEIPEITRVETETGDGDAGTPRGFDADDVPF